MKYTLDSSVAFKWIVTESLSDKAIAFRDEARTGVHEIIAPDIFPIEIAHALAKAQRQGRLGPQQGAILWAEVMSTCPQLFLSLPLIPMAYQLASTARIGVYDCLYLALAQQEQCMVLSADDRLAKQFPQFVVPLANLP